MSEGEDYNSFEDLSEFEDYLEEFKDHIQFDSESCPVCGVKVSDSVSYSNSPYVEFTTVNDEILLNELVAHLNDCMIPFKVEKSLDNSILAEVKYLFKITIPFNCLEEATKIKKAIRRPLYDKQSD